MNDLVMLIPSRGRPGSVRKQADAWAATNATKQVDLVWILDLDDPTIESYERELQNYPWMQIHVQPTWVPMVPKLNRVAVEVAQVWPYVGFMGDDHLPRSTRWHDDLATSLERTGLGPVIVYGKDGFQDQKLATWWAMTSNVITTLGRMVPAPVQHLYCDNAIMELGAGARCLRYLPHVLIEHMHPVAGKGKLDAGYQRVNRRQQYDRDLAAFLGWRDGEKDRDVRMLLDLRGV